MIKNPSVLLFKYGVMLLILIMFLANTSVWHKSSAPYPYHKELWIHKTLNIHDAWNYSLGDGIKIAVLDSGVNKLEELKNSLLTTGYNSINENNDTEDEVGHGTFVASILSAQTNKNDGYVGLAPKAKILPVKVYSESASEDQNIQYLARGIRWAVDNKTDIINISIGFTRTSPDLDEAVSYALQKGVIVISAAGNNGSRELLYPAAIQGVIAVAAATKKGAIWSNSNYNSNSFLAPGDSVVGLLGNGKTDNMSGTSVATPMVSAIAALKKSISPNLSSSNLSKLLKKYDNNGIIDTVNILLFR